MEHKKSRKPKRIAIDQMIKLQSVTLKDVTFMVYAKNRNPKQVPDKLWEEILSLHIEEGRYN